VSSELKRARILFVDDEDRMLRAYQRAFGRDYDVVLADDGEAALALLQRSSFDLIICDLMMPRMTGMELFDRVGAENPSLQAKFIFVTGSATQSDAQAFLRNITNTVLEKPFDTDLLRRLIALRQPARAS
jgi:CheY-like chemotaxis protein